jgi:hypothetical protein
MDDPDKDDPDLIDNFKIKFNTGFTYADAPEGNYPFSTNGLVQVGDMQDTKIYDSTLHMPINDTSTTSYGWWDLFRLFPTTDYIFNSYAEIKYDTSIEGTIKHIGLKMPKSWETTHDGDYTDIYLNINGIYCEKSEGAYSLNANYYMYYWTDVDVSVIDKPVVLEFMVANQPMRYILVNAESDIDGDGNREFASHGDNELWDAIYNGENRFNRDFVYAFWYQAPNYEEGLEEYAYNIDVSDTTVNEGETIDISYTCPVDSAVNLVIEENDIEVYNASTDVTGVTSGAIKYTCMNSGFVNISLKTGATKQIEVSVTVNDIGTIHYVVYTNPSVTKPSDFFDIHYIYNNTAYDGRIEIGDLIFNVERNTNTEKIIHDVQINTEGCYPIFLYVNKNNVSIEKSSNMHTVKNNYANDLYVGYLNPAGGINEYHDNDSSFNYYSTLYFMGKHNFLCKDVYIDVTGHKYSVSDKSLFKVLIDGLSGGTHTAYLRVKTGSGIITLDSFRFKIGDSAIGAEPTTIQTLIRNAFDSTTRMLIGFFIIGAITLSPFVIVVKARGGIGKGSKRCISVQIPNILYGVMFGISVVVVYSLGFIDFALMFFLMFILMTMVILVFLVKRRESSV